MSANSGPGPVVEICVEGIESALAAAAGGADRIELCENLAQGGVTPSLGLIAEACRRLAIPVHVLVRPRPGDFVYSDAEFSVMLRDIEAARSAGAAGVVVGVLDASGAVDLERTGRLVRAARPAAVTFHKAFDVVADPWQALDELVALGVDRVLTSGQSETARAGCARIGELVRRGGSRVVVLAGGRVTVADLPALFASGVVEVHVGSAVAVDGRTDARAVERFLQGALAGWPHT